MEQHWIGIWLISANIGDSQYRGSPEQKASVILWSQGPGTEDQGIGRDEIELEKY